MSAAGWTMSASGSLEAPRDRWPRTRRLQGGGIESGIASPTTHRPISAASARSVRRSCILASVEGRETPWRLHRSDHGSAAATCSTYRRSGR